MPMARLSPALRRMDKAFFVIIAYCDNQSRHINTRSWWQDRSETELIAFQGGLWWAADPSTMQTLSVHRPGLMQPQGREAGADLVAAIKRYKDQHGHCHVPCSDAWRDDQFARPLALDAQHLRTKGRPFSEQSELGKQLTDMGFSWDCSDRIRKRRSERSLLEVVRCFKICFRTHGRLPRSSDPSQRPMYHRLRSVVNSWDDCPEQVRVTLREWGFKGRITASGNAPSRAEKAARRAARRLADPLSVAERSHVSRSRLPGRLRGLLLPKRAPSLWRGGRK